MAKPGPISAKPLSVLLGDVFSDAYAKQGFAARELVTRWAEIAGPEVAAHSEPSRIRNHILPLLGQYELDEVDPLTVQRWVANLLAGKGPSSNGRPRKPIAVKTVHNCHGILFGIMQAAVRQRLIRSNPCSDTQLPKRVHKEMRFLTEPETGRLLAALPPHWRPLVLLLIATGLRWGEAVG